MNVEQIRKKYAPLFYELLMRCEPRKPELGVDVLSRKAEQRAAEIGSSIEEGYRQIYQEARIRVEKRVALMLSCRRKD